MLILLFLLLYLHNKTYYICTTKQIKMNKFITIAKAWGIAVFHTDEQKKLADERMEECNKCEFLGEVNINDMTGGLVDNYFMCINCRCPMQGKMYTPKEAPSEQKCPLGKWKN